MIFPDIIFQYPERNIESNKNHPHNLQGMPYPQSV